MTNRWLVVGLVGALGLGLAACGGDDDDDAGGSPTEADAGDDAGGDAAVHIEGFAFEDVAPVAAGTAFSVENADSASHTITADDDSFDEPIGGTETITVTAPAEPGEYAYHCEIHPNMTGTLVVE